jgi:type III pantothenate kinase
MLTVVDIGNSNIVVAVHDGSDWVQTFRIYSDQKKTTDEYFVVLDRLLSRTDFPQGSINQAVISSVVPNLTRSMQKNIHRLFGVEPLTVDHSVKTGLKRETIPPELGSDLLANAAQAHHMCPNQAVTVVDFGTALTLTTVDGDGSVLGVAIAPGLVTAVNALYGNTAQLPQVELRIPTSVIGRNSQDSIRSGVMYGYSGMIKTIIERTEEEIGKPLYVVATGGLSKTMAPLINRINHVSPNHTLDGLRLIAELNL